LGDVRVKHDTNLTLSQPEDEWLATLATWTAVSFEHPTFVCVGLDDSRALQSLRDGCAEARLVGVSDHFPRWAMGGLKAEIVLDDTGGRRGQFDAPVHLLFVDVMLPVVEMMEVIMNWTPKVAAGGFAVFHNYSRPEPHWHIGTVVDVWLSETEEWETVPSVGSLKAVKRR
jgi:hypothetical protein